MLQEMYQKKWDALLGKAAKCPRCFFDIELDGEKVLGGPPRWGVTNKKIAIYGEFMGISGKL